MELKAVETVAGLVAGLAWPIVVITVVAVFRKQIAELLKRMKEFQGPGIKIALEHLTDKIDSVESATKNLSVDIYRVTGDALRVREEVWQYVAGILDNASPSTKFEMRKALTEYHLPNVGLTVSQAKEMLESLDFLKRSKEEQEQFTEEITSEFIQAVYDFQVASSFAYADGIIGPKTSARLRQESSRLATAQQADRGDA
ncbi:MAG: hypothetical protein KAT65_08760 [Methanophagales archaeon]|nr:hypothetical protein [Methanophagales archaeon]